MGDEPRFEGIHEFEQTHQSLTAKSTTLNREVLSYNNYVASTLLIRNKKYRL